MKPKMQLSLEVSVSDAFRAEINAWMIDFFGYDEEESTEVKPVAPKYQDATLSSIPNKPIKVARKSSYKRKSKTQKPPDMESFSSLLAGLEDSFDTLKMPELTGNWLTKQEISSIKKLGVYVPGKFDMEITDETYADTTKLPAIASALFVPKAHESEPGMIYPRFVFAIKGLKLPVGVERIEGTPFQFGLCYAMNRDDKDKAMKPKVFWGWCWLVVTPEGKVVIPWQKTTITSAVVHKNACYRGKIEPLHLRQWHLPSMAVAETGRDQSTHEKHMKSAFSQLMTWWNKRKDQWSVGVRKDGHRVTFSIEREHTSAYFADRSTVVNVEGKPRKIIHFVREHTRVTGATVKEHVRGLREFDWKGYHCTVTVPDLKGTVITSKSGELTPVLITKEQALDKSRYMSSEELAEELAMSEDYVV